METISCPLGSNAYGFLRASQKYNTSVLPSLTFVDPTVEDTAPLIHAVRSATDLVFLKPSQDGLDQIVTHLRGRGRHAAIHILADIEGGQLSLCGRTLGLRELYERAPDIVRIGRSVTAAGRIMIGAGRNLDARGSRFLLMVAGYAGVAVQPWRVGVGHEL